MSIIHSASVVASATRQVTEFDPTISGRVEANGDVVYSTWSDFAISPSSAYSEGEAGIWLIQTATDCFIRVGANGTGDFGTENWYDTGGTGQGDPGLLTSAGTTVFQLNELADTVNIWNKADNSTQGTPSFSNTTGGTGYTSDDKTTFFSPTQSAKYGRKVLCISAQSGTGTTTEEGNFDIQFTFRKGGKNDYTITFQGHSKAVATVDI